MFSKAIVRTPGKSLIDGLTDSKHLGSPDYQKAITQHKAYIKALQSCGLEVHELLLAAAIGDQITSGF